MYSWWWVRLSPETCRVKPLRRIKRNCCILLDLFHNYKTWCTEPQILNVCGCRDLILTSLLFFIPCLIMFLMAVASGHCVPYSYGGGSFSLSFITLWDWDDSPTALLIHCRGGRVLLGPCLDLVAVTEISLRISGRRGCNVITIGYLLSCLLLHSVMRTLKKMLWFWNVSSLCVITL